MTYRYGAKMPSAPINQKTRFNGNDVLNMSSFALCHTGSGFDMLPN